MGKPAAVLPPVAAVHLGRDADARSQRGARSDESCRRPAVEPRLASGGVWWRNDDSSTPEVTFCGVVHPGYRHRDGRRVRRRTGWRRGISAGPGPEDQVCVVSTEIRTVEFLLVALQSQPNQPLEGGCKQIHVAHGAHRPRCSVPQPSLRDSAAACELACPDGRPRWVISAPCSFSLHGQKLQLPGCGGNHPAVGTFEGDLEMTKGRSP